MSANERLQAVDPRRRVNRELYPKNADMPEFPGAVLLNHVGLRWVAGRAHSAPVLQQTSTAQSMRVCAGSVRECVTRECL